MDYADFVTQVFQEQLGRDPESEGLAYYTNLLATGQATPEQIIDDINRSVEGQNFDTQYITSQYRSLLNRNPEQEGYQYWLSEAQRLAWSPEEITQAIIAGTQAQDQAALQQALSSGYFTNLTLPSFESDPYAGRYTSESRYISDPNAYPNVSYIGDKMYQFMSPITQQPIISTRTADSWAAQVGLDVLSAPQVEAAVQLAMEAGTLDQKDYNTLYNDLANSRSMDDVYAAFNKPQAKVVVDALYGFQTGEAKTLAEAQQEAGVRQQYLDQFGYYPSNFAMADVLARAGVDYPFTYENMQRMGALYKPEDVVTDANFADKLNQVLMTFGAPGFVESPISTEYYSERGLEPGFTPFAEEPTFRSGVAGYTENLPTGFQFGVPRVVAPINTGPQGFQPGVFNQNATGYDMLGNPIFGNSINLGAIGGGYLNNPVIGYAADGSPIYSTAPAQADTSGGG